MWHPLGPIYLMLKQESYLITGLRVSAISEGVDISASILGKVRNSSSDGGYWIFAYALEWRRDTLMDFSSSNCYTQGMSM